MKATGVPLWRFVKTRQRNSADFHISWHTNSTEVKPLISKQVKKLKLASQQHLNRFINVRLSATREANRRLNVTFFSSHTPFEVESCSEENMKQHENMKHSPEALAAGKLTSINPVQVESWSKLPRETAGCCLTTAHAQFKLPRAWTAQCLFFMNHR